MTKRLVKFGFRLSQQTILPMLVFSKRAPEANDVHVRPSGWNNDSERIEFPPARKGTEQRHLGRNRTCPCSAR